MKNILLKLYSEVIVDNQKYIDHLVRCPLSNIANGMQAFLDGYFSNDALEELRNYLEREIPGIKTMDSFIAFSPTFKSHDIALRILLVKEGYTKRENKRYIAVNKEFEKINEQICNKIMLYLTEKLLCNIHL
ncbi:hypothetical protein [Bacillus cereus]|uniref:Uncharacterized protein n=1 Tax=Bacillus cereus (strain VD146) TaxID=1053236 RepID=R8MDS7_BACCX|nr:hypothetical protein [Bacillus cereus]EOP32291.1 hypothetical protein IK1_05827 [Bacillus cereus VD146]